MVRRIGVLLSILLFSALASRSIPVAAQPASNARLTEIFSGLGPGVPIQVVTPSFFVEEAFVTSVGVGEVELTQGGTSLDIGFGDIRGVSVQSTHWLQGTLWGLGAGILVGGVSGLMWASFTCTSPAGCVNAERDGMITGATILGGTGAVAGFLFGKRSFYWRPVFP